MIKTLKSIAYGIWKFGETKEGMIAPLTSNSQNWNSKVKCLTDKGFTGYTRNWEKKGVTVRIDLYKNGTSEESHIVEVDND